MDWKISIKQSRSAAPNREVFTILQKNRGGYRANYYVHFLVYVIFMSGKPIDVVQNMFSKQFTRHARTLTPMATFHTENGEPFFSCFYWKTFRF